MDQKQIIELVKKIRSETSLGIMEIKAALEEANGDEKRAREILKERGFKKAESKKERETRQGRVVTYTHTTGKIGVMIEILCETDFVAKNEEFMALSRDMALQVAAMNPESVEKLMEQEFIKDPTQKVGDLVQVLIAKLGENIKVGRMARFEI